MADIITRAGKGSNLTPTEVDSNFKNLNAAVLAIQGVYGTGTVTSVSTSYAAVNSVLSFIVTNPNTTPLITVAVTGSAGYLKSTGSALSVSATIPFSDTTGTVPVNRGGTNLNTPGVNETLLGSDGTNLVYRTLSSTDSSIAFNWLTSGVLKMVVDPTVISINNLSGTLDIAKGGTGQTTLSGIISVLLPSQTSNAGKVLSTDGAGVLSWIAAGGSGTVTSVTGSGPIVSSGGTTPVISMAVANTSTNGYLSSTDWNTFNNKGSGTVTSVAALTIGTTGTNITSTVATGTTTPVITLNIPTASATNRGALSSADWNIFNNKIGGDFNIVAGGSITFAYNIWYTSDDVILPSIASTDVGKILFVKNTNDAATSKVNAFTGATIDGAASITLSHAAGGLNGGIIIQARTTSLWSILSHTGAIS